MATVEEVMRLLKERKVLEALKLSGEVDDRELMAEKLKDFAGTIEYVTGSHHDLVEIILQQALLLDPQNPYVYYNLGVHYTEEDVVAEDPSAADKAVRAYRKALKLKPDLHEARYNLALLYYFTGRFDKAKVEYKILLEACPRDLRFLEMKPLFESF